MLARSLVLIGVILAAALSRLLPHPPNFTPIAAMALFAGAYFAQKRLAFAVPFAAMLLSDLIIGFHQTMIFVYASFAIIVVIGFALRSRRQFLPIAGATFTGSVLFFLITNFGVWALSSGRMFPHTLSGLMGCYAYALPFFQNTLVGDAFYATILFGGFAFAQRWLPAEQPALPSAA